MYAYLYGQILGTHSFCLKNGFLKPDEYSDLDLFIVTEDATKWYSGEFPSLLGEVSISFNEHTLGGGMERRCI